MPYKDKETRNAKFREKYSKLPLVYYTYLWLRKDGTPYYVGKGVRKRAYVNHRNGDKLHCPKNKEYILVQEFESEEDAFFAEKFLIALYGRKDNGTGILRNLTDGGENPPKGVRKGSKMPIHVKEKLIAANIGRIPWNKGIIGYRIHTEESKASIAKAQVGRKSTPNQIEATRKRSTGNTYALGRKTSEETKKLQRENHNPLSNLEKDHKRGKSGRFVKK